MTGKNNRMRKEGNGPPSMSENTVFCSKGLTAQVGCFWLAPVPSLGDRQWRKDPLSPTFNFIFKLHLLVN